MAALLWGAATCAPSAEHATSTPAPSPSASPSTAAACTADAVLQRTRELLAGQTFEAFYLTISDELTLAFYVVDPTIDPEASKETVSANRRLALERGLSIAYRLIDEVPCTGQVFEDVNPMVADSRYQTWYLDVIPISVFSGLHDPTVDELIEAVEDSGANLGFVRRNPPRPEDRPTPTDACAWPQARLAMQGQFNADEDNTAAYLLIGDARSAQDTWDSHARPTVVVQAQWDIHDAAEAEDTVLLERLGRMAGALGCLWPRVDQFEVFVVDQTGQLNVYCVVPGALIGPGASPLPSGSVVLHHYPSPTTEPQATSP
jgi:hypothetical protein